MILSATKSAPCLKGQRLGAGGIIGSTLNQACNCLSPALRRSDMRPPDHYVRARVFAVTTASVLTKILAVPEQIAETIPGNTGSGKKRRLLWISLSLMPFFLAAAYVSIPVFNIFHAHEHCIKQAGAGFALYSSDHFGNLPYDTNGFGNALLLLVKDGYLGDTNEHYIYPITGPGDDGSIFRQALRTGARIPEQLCSRIYIQGLSETNSPDLAILWDKKSTRGGDHFRRPWGPPLREVCLLDGSMQIIPDKDWPAFVSNQVELLVKNGIPRATARHYYEIP